MDPRTALDALAQPELGPLWESARRRLERNGRTITGSPIELTGQIGRASCRERV